MYCPLREFSVICNVQSSVHGPFRMDSLLSSTLGYAILNGKTPSKKRTAAFFLTW